MSLSESPPLGKYPEASYIHRKEYDADPGGRSCRVFGAKAISTVLCALPSAL